MLEEGKQQSDDQILESVEGLSAYVRQTSYREALGLP